MIPGGSLRLTLLSVGAESALLTMCAPREDLDLHIDGVVAAVAAVWAVDPDQGALVLHQLVLMLADSFQQVHGGPLSEKQAAEEQEKLTLGLREMELAEDDSAERENDE